MQNDQQRHSNKTKNRKWTERENEALRQGILQFGAGKWKKIKDKAGTVLDNRSNVDLKDRYRNMQSVRDRILMLMGAIPGEHVQNCLIAPDLEEVRKCQNDNVEHLNWELLPNIERKLKALQESEHKRVAFKNVASQQNKNAQAVFTTTHPRIDPERHASPGCMRLTGGGLSSKLPRYCKDTQSKAADEAKLVEEVDEPDKRSAKKREWIDEKVFMSPAVEQQPLETLQHLARDYPCKARLSDIHQLSSSPKTNDMGEPIVQYSANFAAQCSSESSSEDEEVELISADIPATSEKGHNSTSSSGARGNKPERFYCGYIHDLVLYAGNSCTSTRQVRSWLLSHPHLCPVDSFQDCDIDHIIPRSLGGHDHPYNYYIMPKSMNQKFNKWMTKEVQINSYISTD
ncbi:hypothetical protein GUITHDRAFT_134028 [Guillardia theta CCMP2712]|uniref:Uncharacterized protein n=1 Tax=Guillardia theta (strain CCMP2712) TaxID=905079 RepID=L1JW81_GUITC|nr:hypothetical protein GUITHDRAFT_134028 [Guillardia theta CCMP2712]EKX52343.1 hypothetical protein GUITHDRAFT_134028 [Guillardia theta CCMP2712]|eukprot:XP_005839323.1 hypothetical protein GUITHDRAFT_134028 [Guillardia theta CCMP2712]